MGLAHLACTAVRPPHSGSRGVFSLSFAGQRIVPGLAGALRVLPRPDGARARSSPAREDTTPRDPQTTTLHRVVREHLKTFLARHAEAGEPMPFFVVDELRDYLSCRLNMPRAEGGPMRGLLGLYAAGLSIPTRRVAPPFGDGAVHEAELQLYADGRCAVSLDGELLGVSENTVLLDMPLRVHLSGQSVGTLVEVEEVEVWEGVRTPSVSRSPTR